MMEPEVSVVIPCHNAALVLPLQLGALAQQVDPPPFEVVIVDNRSTDDISGAVDLWRPELMAAGALDVRLVTASREAGASYARNLGVSEARADRLVFCDADDCVAERWLSDARALFDRADIFSGSAIPIAEVDFPETVDGARSLIRTFPEPEPEIQAQEELAIPIVMGGNFGVRRELFEQVGGFDRSLGSAGEDNDLAVRVRHAGHPISGSPAMKIAYRTRTHGRLAREVRRRAARTHVLLCVRYGVYSESQYVGGGRLVRATWRLGGSIGLNLLRRRSADWSGLRLRAAGIIGYWEGVLLYRMLRRVPDPRFGFL